MKHSRVTNLTMTIMLGGLTQLVGCGSNNPAAASCPGVALDAGVLDAADLDAESLDPPSNGVPDPPPIDYSNQASWRRLGDWTGSIDPTPIAPVDVFFLYPTTFFPGPENPNHTGPSDPDNWPLQGRWNQNLLQAQADPGIEAQVYSKAGVFFDEAGKTNLYVPFYKQAAGNYVLPALLYKQQDQKHYERAYYALYNTAYLDVSNAFEYYLAHYNKDSQGKPRPFILAGHSQGSNLLLMLLRDKFADEYVLKDQNGYTITNGTTLRKQLIAAYAIGWSVTSASEDPPYLDMVHLKKNKLSICNRDTQTGCIVTYNTQQDAGDFSQAKPYPLSPFSPPTGVTQRNSYSVNPLTWVANGPPDDDMGITSDTEPTAAAAEKNLGALFFKLNDVKPYWHLGLGDDNKFNCSLRPQLGPFIPPPVCPYNCPSCPGPATGIAESPGVVEPSWVLASAIANWSVYHAEINNYTGAQNKQGALVIDPTALPAPGNYKNLNPPYNTNDAKNDPTNVNNPNNQPPGWYHNYDYSFFWRNLERNARDRIAAWLPSN